MRPKERRDNHRGSRGDVEQKQKNQRQRYEHGDPPLFRGETDCAEKRKPESRADVFW
jgi:hypothetical protein